MSASNPPHSDEIEISIFGPGYGESLVLHLGNREWMVIDSCRAAGVILPLQYLRELNVDLSTEVKLVLATHWHGDHIGGLSKIVEACSVARIFCSGALGSHEILTLAELHDEIDGSRSALAEFYRLQKFADANPGRVGYAGVDRLLWKRGDSTVTALSPSDEAKRQATAAVAALLRDGAAKTRVFAPEPNHNSVAVSVCCRNLRALLGSDLEEESPCRGWSIVLDSPVRDRSARASAYKISHHASQNGHHDGIWNELLEPRPVAICTPFKRGNVSIPTREDVIRTLAKTSRAFITCVPKDRNDRPKSGVVNRTILETVKWIRNVNDRPGQIRLRRPLDGSSPWQVELFGTATLLDTDEFSESDSATYA